MTNPRVHKEVAEPNFKNRSVWLWRQVEVTLHHTIKSEWWPLKEAKAINRVLSWEWTTSFASSCFLFPNLSLLSTCPTWWGWGFSQSPQPNLKRPGLLQKATANADPPEKGTSACSHTEQEPRSNKLIGVMNLPLVSRATQASQSNGIGGVSRDSEGQGFVWGVKAASWRKWSMSWGDCQFEWDQECLWIFKAEGIGCSKVLVCKEDGNNSECLRFGLNGRGKWDDMGRWDGIHSLWADSEECQNQVHKSFTRGRSTTKGFLYRSNRTYTLPPASMQKVGWLEGVETRGWLDQQGGYFSSPDER